jgi:hypothetical protein
MVGTEIKNTGDNAQVTHGNEGTFGTTGISKLFPDIAFHGGLKLDGRLKGFDDQVVPVELNGRIQLQTRSSYRRQSRSVVASLEAARAILWLPLRTYFPVLDPLQNDRGSKIRRARSRC